MPEHAPPQENLCSHQLFMHRYDPCLRVHLAEGAAAGLFLLVTSMVKGTGPQQLAIVPLIDSLARKAGLRKLFLTDCLPPPIFQLLTVSATRENEVQQLVVTFTGNTTDQGVKMMADAPTNAFVSLTFDSGSMNWACTDASVTTSNVRSTLNFGDARNYHSIGRTHS